MTPPVNEVSLKEWLKPLQDPELHMGLVDLGLIYECNVANPEDVRIKMTLTSPGCPAAAWMVEQVRARAAEHPEVKNVKVELVFEPKWDPKTMASEEAKEKLGIW